VTFGSAIIDDTDLEGEVLGIIDDFDNRTIPPTGGDLGTSSTGYSIIRYSGSLLGEVANGYCTISGPSSSSGTAGYTFSPLPLVQGNFKRTQRFRVNWVPGMLGGPSPTIPFMYFDANSGAVYAELDAEISSDAAKGLITLYTDDASIQSVVKTNWVVDAWYTMEIIVSGATVEGRIWRDGDARPTAADVTGATGATWVTPSWDSFGAPVNPGSASSSDPSCPATLLIDIDDIAVVAV
jgi:hypothetical protein